MSKIKDFSCIIKSTYSNNSTNSQSKTLHKMLELLELNNAIQRYCESSKSMIGNSDPQLLVMALLSSFVMTARSVTNIMQKEYTHTDGFLDWYNAKREIMDNDVDMKFFDKLRTEIFHTEVLLVDRKFTFIPSKSLKFSETQKQLTTPELQYQQNGNFTVTNEHFSIDDTPIPGVSSQIILEYYFDSRPEKEARWLCLEHFQKLAKIIDEGESKFKPTYH